MDTTETQTTSNFQEWRAAFIEAEKKAYAEWEETVEVFKTDTSDTAIRNNLKAYDSHQAAIQERHAFECEHITRQLGSVLPQLIREQIILHRNRAQRELDKMFAEYEDDRKNGVPFAEREAKIDHQRIAMLKQIVDGGEPSTQDIEVLPAQEWLPDLNGYDKLKELGVKEYVRRNFLFMYKLKK